MSSQEGSVVDAARTTFSAGVVGLVAASAATDIFTISGSSVQGRKIKVLRIEVSGIATASAAIAFNVVKRSTANTGGTSTNPTAVAHEAVTGLSASCTVTAYTANPTTGTSVGVLQAKRGTLLTAAAGTPASPTPFDFTTANSKFPTLNGANEILALNFNGQTAAGNALDIFVTWSEE
jgi:hypothetical protein